MKRQLSCLFVLGAGLSLAMTARRVGLLLLFCFCPALPLRRPFPTRAQRAALFFSVAAKCAGVLASVAAVIAVWFYAFQKIYFFSVYFAETVTVTVALRRAVTVRSEPEADRKKRAASLGATLTSTPRG
jgi:hypothetical protein